MGFRNRKICDLCRRNNEIYEYNIISSEDISFSSEEKPVSSAKSTQSKVKNSKENNKKTPYYEI